MFLFVFGCVVSICRAVFFGLCCEYLQSVSLFGCVVSICSVFLFFLVVL